MAYHVTQRGTNHQRVFFSASDRAAYLRLLQRNLAPAETRVLAWCLMTNHVHLVLVPDREDSLGILLRRLHGRYAQMVNARRLRLRGLARMTQECSADGTYTGNGTGKWNQPEACVVGVAEQAISSTPKACGLVFQHPRRRRAR
jgi:REP element-mobilizing transposase RayT